MFFFPYNTDAPLYHYPIGTVLLIVINVVVFGAELNMDEATLEALILTFDSVRPTQWVTSNFMHAGIMHLGGNMLFLWSFGLIVEGKLGWYRFLPIYLGIGALCGAILQFSMLGSGSGALGASTAIFGVIAIALVWAPRNELSCILFLFYRGFHFDVAVTTMAMIYLSLNIVFFVVGGFAFSSEALHLLGFMVGAPIGVIMLKRNWVDCEGWDLFEVWAGRAGKVKLSDELREDARETFAKTDELLYERAQHERETALELLREHLAEDRTRIAFAVFEKTAGADGTRWELPENELFQLISCLNTEKMWSESVPLLVQAIRRFPHRAVPIRLHLAKIMVQVEHRPKQALAVLAKLPDELPEEARPQRDKIVQLAQSSIEEGEVELEIKDW